jgi:small subunit ribosomal protein S4
MVSHGFICINGKKVDIPSYQANPKDVVSLNPVKINKKIMEQITERIKSVEVPSWMHFEKDKLQAKILEFPKLKESERGFDVKAVIEFYSR